MLPERIELRIDERFDAQRSVALRYAAALMNGILSSDDLLACSRREGVRLLDLGLFGGVRLVLLDESTCMASGTYKSLDGCVSTAMCRRRGISRAVFSSGANAGAALSLYGERIGLESFFFCPAANLNRLDDALFDRRRAHLIAVEGSDRRVKQAAQRMSDRLAAPVIPTLDWRMLSAGCRGLFLAEQIIRQGQRFDWLAQAVCAGYGPLGIYGALEGLVRSGQLDRGRAPRFLGVQQAGLCPIVEAWRQGRPELAPLETTRWRQTPIEPVLYNVHPDQTYPLLRRTLETWGGDMLAVDQGLFDRFAGEFVARLDAAGVRLTRATVDGREQFLEKAGLLAGAGALAAIAQGRIAPGQTVLCALTGGAGPAPSKPATAEHRIGLEADLDEAVDRLAGNYSAAHPAADRGGP